MNGYDLLELFRAYVDEPDQTFVSDDNAKAYINQGYREFRNRAISCNPSTYRVSATLTLTDVNEYDLALAANPVRLLGANPSTDRLSMLLNLRKVEAATGDDLRVLRGVSSRRALETNPDGYFLDGSVLRFPEKVTGSFVVDYVPATPAITAWAAGGAEFDDMVDWHDLIVLYATKAYLIRDGGENAMLTAQMGIRERDFMNYIQERDVEAPMYVNEVYHTLDESW